MKKGMSKNIIFAFLILMGVMLVLAATAGAELRAGAFTISPMANGHLFEGNQDYDNGVGGGIGIGMHLTERWAMEMTGKYFDSETEAGEDMKNTIFQFDVLYHFMPKSSFVPYLAVGYGLMKRNLESTPDYGSTFLNWGGGVKYFINDWFGLRADVRHIFDEGGSGYKGPFSNMSASLGLTFLFGGASPVQQAAMPLDSDRDGVYDSRDRCPGTSYGVIVDSAGCPKDSDGDGVPDSSDRCPGTPAGAPVDAAGCPKDTDGDGVYDYLDRCPGTPAGVSVDSVGCPKDSDGDGVYDNMDRCPATPAGVEVDSVGCPKDTDGDGVYDYLDKCPGTPVEAPVDEAGCPLDTDKDQVYDYIDKCPDTPIGAKVNPLGCWVVNVHFDTGKWDIKPVDYDELDAVVEVLKRDASFDVEIQGHTDNRGSYAYNQALSEKRAKAVMNYLIGKGIPKSRMTAKGYGEKKPLVPNTSPVNMQLNRRVQIEPIR